MENRNFEAAINYALARKYVLKNLKITDYEPFIKELHSIVCDGLDELAGAYRTDEKIISGTYYTPPKPSEIENRMKDFCNHLNMIMSQKEENPIMIASKAHCELIKIAPFNSYNKSVARLLTSHILLNTIGRDIDFSNFDIQHYINSTVIYCNTNEISFFYDFLNANLNGADIAKTSNIKMPEDIENEQNLFAEQQLLKNDYNIEQQASEIDMSF